MNLLKIAVLSIALGASPVLADDHATGDPAAGEKVYKKCKSCHSLVNAEGEVIAKGGRNGPNLFGIYERQAGSEVEFGKKFGKSMRAAGEAGLNWNEAEFVGFIANPKKFLGTYLDDKKAKSKMSFKLKKEQDAKDVWAYLVSVGPVPEPSE